MIEIFKSGEFWAALLGAGAAFVLEGFRRWRNAVKEDVRAGNAAIFVLSQMYTLLRNIHDRFFVDRRAQVRQQIGRDRARAHGMAQIGGPRDNLWFKHYEALVPRIPHPADNMVQRFFDAFSARIEPPAEFPDF